MIVKKDTGNLELESYSSSGDLILCVESVLFHRPPSNNEGIPEDGGLVSSMASYYLQKNEALRG